MESPANLVPHQNSRRQLLDPKRLSLATDASDYKNAIDYVNFFVGTFGNQNNSLDLTCLRKFSISDIRKYFKMLSKKDQDVLKKFFAIDGGLRHYLKQGETADISLKIMPDWSGVDISAKFLMETS